MSLKDFIDHPERYSHHPKPVSEERQDETYYEDRTPRREPVMESEEDDDDRDVLEEINFYKERLYKKIDGCFVRYGLEGLRRIEEGIANSIADYIADLKGTPRPRRVQEAAPQPAPQAAQAPRPAAPQKPFTPPKKIVEAPQAPQRPVQNGWRNDEIMNKILNDIIPPTEIHEVQINSNIPVDQIMEQRRQSNQKVELAPQPQMAESIPGDQMIEESNGYEAFAAPEPEVIAPAPVAMPQPTGNSNYDIANDMLDKRTVQEAESISMVVAPTGDWNPSMDDGSEDELNAPIVESEVQTPIEVKPTPRKKKKKG